jgi:hypothetical protein
VPVSAGTYHLVAIWLVLHFCAGTLMVDETIAPIRLRETQQVGGSIVMVPWCYARIRGFAYLPVDLGQVSGEDAVRSCLTGLPSIAT